MVVEAGLVEDGAEWDFARQDLGTEVLRKVIKQDFDEAVFDGGTAVGGVEGDFAEVEAAALLGMDDFERDGVGVETLELGGHVVVVDQKLLEWIGDCFGGDPVEGGAGEVGA